MKEENPRDSMLHPVAGDTQVLAVEKEVEMGYFDQYSFRGRADKRPAGCACDVYKYQVSSDCLEGGRE